jgi:hypothetical protein
MSNKSNPVARAGNTELRDGSRHPGLQTPAFREGDLGTLQPHIFVANRGVQFWGGVFGVAAEERRALYTRWGKGPTRFFRCGSARILPYRQIVAGHVDGLYRLGRSDIQIEYWAYPARASAILLKRSSRRASSSGIDMPSGMSAASAASALAISSATSACNCASILPACS